MTRYNVSLSVFRALVEVSLSIRANCMSAGHKVELDEVINVMESKLGDAYSRADPNFGMYRNVRRKVAYYIRRHNEFLMNVSTNIELALWRIILTESTWGIDDPEAKMNIRANCGNTFQVVIPNVLAFL